MIFPKEFLLEHEISFPEGVFAEDLTLEHISQKFHISTYYFSRKYKEVSGLSFTDYVNNVRIKESQKLLLHTDMQVIDIGQE